MQQTTFDELSYNSFLRCNLNIDAYQRMQEERKQNKIIEWDKEEDDLMNVII